ncbi:predicted protein, partial [Postia placenta Mad-698-R]
MTGWADYLDELDLLKSRRAIRDLVSFTQLPTAKEPVLQELENWVWHYITWIHDSYVTKAPYLVRRMILHCPIDESNGEAFRPLPKHQCDRGGTLYRYSQMMTRFLATIMRSIDNCHPCKYQFPLLETQVDLITALHDSLRDNKTSLSAFHTIWYFLIGEPFAFTEVDKWKCPVLCWLALASVREDGRFIDANEYTPLLAEWEYLMRITHLTQAYRNFEAECQTTDIRPNFITICSVQFSQFLKEGVNSPYNSVREHQHFASSIAKNTAAAPRITWSSDMTELACDGNNLQLSRLRFGLNAIALDIETRINKLMNGHTIPINVSDSLTENMSNRDLGYGWMELPNLLAKSFPLLEILQDHPHFKICEVEHNGKLHWIHRGIMAVLSEFTIINEELAILCHMLPAPPPRGTELVETRIRNGQIPRNLYKDRGTWFMTQNPHHSIMNSCSVSMVMFSPLYTARFMGISLNLRTWRHMAISIQREYIGEQDTIVNNLGDLLANHSTSQARRTYAREVGSLPFLTTDAMLESRDICDSWHDVLGWGSNLPPIPHRLLHRLRTSSTTMDPTTFCTSDFKEEIKGMVNGAVTIGMGNLKHQLEDMLANAFAKGFASHTHAPQAIQPQHPAQLIHVSNAISTILSPPPANLSQASLEYATQVQPAMATTITHTLASNTPNYFLDDKLFYTHLGEHLKLATPQPDQMLRLLKWARQDSKAIFKSEAQMQMLFYIIKRDCNLMVVLPTGGGKSLAWEVPGKMAEPKLITIIMIPFLPLIDDQLRRSAASRIVAAKWNSAAPPTNPKLRLLFASYESLATSTFIGWIKLHQENIARLIFDESHEPLVSGNYRPKMQMLTVVQEFTFPKVYLTATMPPDTLRPFCQLMGADPRFLHLIRAATNRPELRYHVVLSEYQEKGETMAMELVQYLDQHHIKPDSRGLIFCRTIAQAAMFEETFDILAYHSDKSDEERTQAHQRWYAGAKIGDRWMAATTSFIHGIDYPFVDFIVFPQPEEDELADLAWCLYAGGHSHFLNRHLLTTKKSKSCETGYVYTQWMFKKAHKPSSVKTYLEQNNFINRVHNSTSVHNFTHLDYQAYQSSDVDSEYEGASDMDYIIAGYEEVELDNASLLTQP